MSETAENTQRGAFVKRLAQSGVVVSKSGGAYRDPASIVSSETAQKQLDTLSHIKPKK